MSYLSRNPILVWRAIPEIHIEKEDFTVISVKYIHKKNYLCLLQPQRSKRLHAVTMYIMLEQSYVRDILKLP